MEEVEVIASRWQHWHYKNTALLILSVIIFFLLTEHPLVQTIISFVGNLGYFGAFFTGMLFVSIFTVVPAAAVIYFLANNLNSLFVAIVAGAGAVMGDFLIFWFLKDRVFEELKPLFLRNGGNALIKLFKTPYFAWLVPFIGAVIIASPLPDEIGIGLMGISRLKNWQFLIISFTLNTIGIYLLITTINSF